MNCKAGVPEAITGRAPEDPRGFRGSSCRILKGDGRSLPNAAQAGGTSEYCVCAHACSLSKKHQTGMDSFYFQVRDGGGDGPGSLQAVYCSLTSLGCLLALK